MKKILSVSAALFLLITTLLAFAGSPAEAKSVVPANTGCSFGCNAFLQWNGTNHGAATQFTIDVPSQTGLSTYKKQLVESQADGSYIAVGEQFGAAETCGTNNWYYFFQWYNADVGGSYHIACFNIPSADVNKSASFKISYFASNGGGGYAWIAGGSSGNICNPCAINDPEFAENWDSNITMQLSLQQSNFTGHYVWGGDWQQNQVFIGGSWFYQTNPSSSNCNSGNGCPHGGPPPQMYWHIYPANSGLGGDLYSCVYDSSSESCTKGS